MLAWFAQESLELDMSNEAMSVGGGRRVLDQSSEGAAHGNARGGGK